MSTITPSTKIAELLEHWPDLEPILIAQSPAFQKLRNPVLRRTIARVASLEQAAAIAGLSPRDLVTTLRRAAGQPVDDAAVSAPATALAAEVPCAREVPLAQAAGGASTGDAATAARVIDADVLLQAGEVPLKPIFDAAATLSPGEILRVFVSFRPVPLIERLEAHGYDCTTATCPDGRCDLSISRRSQR